jgi:hypothetical protein
MIRASEDWIYIYGLIFDHLLYHIRELRGPMSIYAKAFYSKIGDDE